MDCILVHGLQAATELPCSPFGAPAAPKNDLALADWVNQDKGTLDAMLHGSLWDPEDDVKENTKLYIDEVSDVDRGHMPHIDGLLRSPASYDLAAYGCM